MTKKQTSITVDPEIWEKFDTLKKFDGLSRSARLERFMREAINSGDDIKEVKEAIKEFEKFDKTCDKAIKKFSEFAETIKATEERYKEEIKKGD